MGQRGFWDEDLELQVNDRRSFEEFIGLGVMNSIPDATTVAFFRERLRNTGANEELFELFDQHLRTQGYVKRGVVRLLMPLLCPFQSSETPGNDNQTIKSGEIPEKWLDQPNRLQLKDTNARWIKKNGVNYYNYKNSISVDAEHGFIKKYVVTPANVHDSQMLPALLDPTNDSDSIWADSEYSGLLFHGFLEAAGFHSRIHEIATWSLPLSEKAKSRNILKSKIRARVEHVFGQIEMSRKGKYTRQIGIRLNPTSPQASRNPSIPCQAR